MRHKGPLVAIILGFMGFVGTLGGEYLKTEAALGTAATQLQIEQQKDEAERMRTVCLSAHELAGDETPSPLLDEAERHAVGEIIVRNLESCNVLTNPAVRALPPPVAQPPKELQK